MSSYQQIPASQNPYPSLPYSQDFPDESEITESSHLQASLNNQPQHYYPSHYEQQQPVPMNQPDQSYGANHQPQFMVIPVDPERVGLGMKISDIEKRLDSGWYFIYKIYLWINIVVCIISLLQLCACLFILPTIEDDLKGPEVNIVTIGVIFVFMSLYGWILHYSLVFKNAMSDKSLKGARRGLKSMIRFSVFSLVITIFLIGAAEYVRTSLVPNSQVESWVPYYVQGFMYLFALPTFLRLFGAKKVIDSLTERETFVNELNTRYGTNLA